MNPIQEMLDSVKQGVLESHGSGEIRNATIRKLTEDECRRRSELLTGALLAYKAANKQVDAVRPDVVAYDENGKKSSEAYSKARAEERQKAIATVKRIDEAVVAAIGGDYSKLENIKTEEPKNP